jgi:hypothetical protein
LSKLFFITFSYGTGLITLVVLSSLLLHEVLFDWNEFFVTILPQSKLIATPYGGDKMMKPLDEARVCIESFLFNPRWIMTHDAV